MSSTITHRSFLIALTIAAAGLLFMSIEVSYAHGAQGHGTDNTATSTMKKGKKIKNVDATCMATAVDTRETALMSAFSDFHEAVEDGLTTRATALKAAWNMSDAKERNTALKATWKEWKSDRKEAHAEFRTDRKAAWEAFKKTAKDSCKMTTPKDEALEASETDGVTI